MLKRLKDIFRFWHHFQEIEGEGEKVLFVRRCLPSYSEAICEANLRCSVNSDKVDCIAFLIISSVLAFTHPSFANNQEDNLLIKIIMKRTTAGLRDY